MKNVSVASTMALLILFLVLGAAAGLWWTWGSEALGQTPRRSRTPARPAEIAGKSEGEATGVSELPQKGASTPRRPLPTDPPEKPPLLARLERFRDLLRERQLGEKLPKSDHDRVLERISAGWRDLHDAIFAEPEIYVRFLRAPENESLCEGLLGVLSMAPVPAPYQLSTVGMNPLPKSILGSLYEMLDSGEAGQKLAILKMTKDTFHMDVNSYMPIVDRCRALLSDGDPRVQIAALGVLEAKSREKMDGTFDLVKQLSRNPADVDTEILCLRSAARMDRPEAQEFLQKGLAEIIERRAVGERPPILSGAMMIVSEKLCKARPEEVGAYADLIESGMRHSQSLKVYEGWVGISLGLPQARLTALLHEAQAHAPSVELRDAAQRVLAQLQSGESREEMLKKAYFRK